jgi:hypothetical protein
MILNELYFVFLESTVYTSSSVKQNKCDGDTSVGVNPGVVCGMRCVLTYLVVYTRSHFMRQGGTIFIW